MPRALKKLDPLLKVIRQIKVSARTCTNDRHGSKMSLIDLCTALEQKVKTEHDADLVDAGFRLLKYQQRLHWDAFYSAFKSHEATSRPRSKRRPGPSTKVLLTLIGMGKTNSQIKDCLQNGNEFNSVKVYNPQGSFVFEDQETGKSSTIKESNLDSKLSKLRNPKLAPSR